MPASRLVILYNDPILPADHPDAAAEHDVFETVEVVRDILVGSGFRVARLGVGQDLTDLLRGLEKARPAAVFNLFEGLGDRPFTETVVAGILEWHNIAFTGSPADALALARDKRRAKLLMHGAGLPTAPFVTVEQPRAPKCPFPWPVIVKPAGHDASVGIDQASVVTNQKDLARRVEYVFERYGPVLIERYVPGREFHISVVEGAPVAGGPCEPLVLPLSEIVFKNSALWPIYSYRAKWAQESDEYAATPHEAPIIVPPALAERLIDIAKRAHRLLGCRDYSRVDVRVTPEGEPFILEVNPNPYLYGEALTNGFAAVGLTHAQFIADLAQAALDRRVPHAARPRGLRSGTRRRQAPAAS